MFEIIQFLFMPFLACLTMIGIFGYFGTHVLERKIVFIDIALAQIVAVGSAVAFIIWNVEANNIIAYLCAFGFTLLAAIFYSFTNKRITQIPQEAIMGASYAIAAAGALFLLAMATGGNVHLEDMLTGSILWANWTDVITCVVVFGVVGLFHIVFRKNFKKISQSYQGALNEGLKAPIWDFLFYVSLGIVITYSIRIAGVLVVFSFLIIPATFSALFTKSWKKRLVCAWLVGTIASILGLTFSYFFDFSSGPSIVSFLGLALIVAAIFKKLRKRRPFVLLYKRNIGDVQYSKY